MGIKAKTLVDSIHRNTHYFEDLVTRSIYNSNAIEGSTISYYDTYALVFNNNVRITATPREIYEAVNLKYALRYIFSNYDKKLTVDMIKHIRVLINMDINEISGFRTQQVYIRGASHIPPSANEVPHLISELVHGIKISSYKSVYDYMSDFHCTFERIHPFVDGNGRVGRLLLMKQSMMHGLPPIVIPFEKRSEYMNCLQMCDILSLSGLLQECCELERDRMTQFGIN